MFGISKNCGSRWQMEDRCQALQLKQYRYAGVFDGHGGSKCANFVNEHFPPFLLKEMEECKNGVQCLEKTFEKMSSTWACMAEMCNNMMQTMGTTAVVALVDEKEIVCGNIGDSTCVLALQDGSVDVLSTSHKCCKEENKAEYDRVTQLGAEIVSRSYLSRTAYYVQGNLNMTRAFGDLYLRPYVIDQPDIVQRAIPDNADFLVLGSDGVFDTFEPKQVCAFLQQSLQTHGSVQKAADELMDRVLASEYYQNEVRDNVALVVLDLQASRTVPDDSSTDVESTDEVDNEDLPRRKRKIVDDDSSESPLKKQCI